MVAANYRMHHIDSYLSDGSLRFIVTFEKRTGPDSRSIHGLTQTQFDAAYELAVAAGFTPINVSVNEVHGSLRWTALFEKLDVSGWTMMTVPAADYGGTAATEEAAGRSLTFVNGTSIHGSPFLTMIWLAPVGGTTSRRANASAQLFDNANQQRSGSADTRGR